MGGIDYSKWDKFGDDDSDDDGDDSNHAPRVTALDGPTSVTIAPDGSLSANHHHSAASSRDVRPRRTTGGVDYSKWDGFGDDEDDDDDEPEYEHGDGDYERAPPIDASNEPRSTAIATATTTAPSSSSSSSSSSFSSLARNGGTFVDPRTGRRVYWSQDREVVELSLFFSRRSVDPSKIRASISVSPLPYADRRSAVGEAGRDRATLRVVLVEEGGASSSKEEKELPLLEGVLPRPTHAPERDDDDDDVDDVEWEIVTDPLRRLGPDPTNNEDESWSSIPMDDLRLLRVTLRKAAPAPDVVVWWDRVFAHAPAVDVRTLPDRRGVRDNGAGQTAYDARAAWDEAHTMFRERRRREKAKTAAGGGGRYFGDGGC